MHFGHRFLRRGLLAGLVLASAGCSSPRYTPSGEPLLDVRNPELRVPDRVEAAQLAWASMEAGEREREATRRALKDLAWSPATPIDVRVECVALLLDDADQAGQADARAMARLMLPTERSRSVVSVIASRAGERGWTEMTSALVRSYARSVDVVEDDDRAEAIALSQMYPGRDVAELVFEVFLDPGYDDTPTELRLNQRTRADVWNLLARLDASGGLRRDLIARAKASTVPPAARASVQALDRGLNELSVIPQTGEELRWLESLRSGSAENERWWAESVSAVARLSAEQRAGLALRHIEAVRWASVHEPSLVTRSRQDLLGELEARLRGQNHQRRTAEKTVHRQPRREGLSDWAANLSWGDVVSLLVAHEAVRQPALLARLFDQVEIDRLDRTTEYGGLIEAVESPQPGSFRAVLYRPRQRDRQSDSAFVASDDMIRASDRALLHYHMHVQKVNNTEYAGPSDADLDYAASSGRACVVFTSLSLDELNVDFYLPGGVVIDLGTVRRPGETP